MKNSSPKVDAYIGKAAPFAQPILRKLRALFHKACPEIEEVMKWSFPHFQYKGIVGSMAAFKSHVSFGFWKGRIMKDPHGLFAGVGRTSMNSLSLKSIGDLPADRILLQYIREAVRLNEEEVKVPRADRKPAKKMAVPAWFIASLRKNRKALATFEGFSTSHRNEYVEWVTTAKQEATREKRLATAVEWMAQGKPRNWKYMK